MRLVFGGRILPIRSDVFIATIAAVASCVAILFELPPALASPVPPERGFAQKRRVRVRLMDAVSEFRVRGLDLKVSNSIARKNLKADLTSEWVFKCVRGAVHAQQLAGVGKQNRSFILGAQAEVRTPAGFLLINGRPYREEIRLYAGRRGCEVVNHLDLEKYLDGLVNAEFSARWSEEAIAAQVVAARTYAIYQMNHYRKRHYDVESDVTDQVYGGSAIEDFRASRVVAKSQGLILTTGSPRNFKPLKAFYHSTCGGATELPQKVWGKPHPGFQTGVQCKFCQSSPKFRWQVTLGSPDVVRAFIRGMKSRTMPKTWPKDALRWIEKGKLIGLAADRVNASGRVEQVSSLWTLGDKALRLSLPGSRFRSWLGTTQIQSAAFRAVAVQGTRDLKWLFEGRGYGHGVGMCQWGAKVMGEKGFSMAQILKHYYPGAVLRKVW